MTLRLNGTSSGFTEIDAPAAAGSNKITLPTSNGSAEQFLKNSGTAGELEFSSMVETSTGIGIGVSNPQRKVHVDGGSGGVQIQLTNDTTGKTSDGDGFQLQLATDGTARVTQRENLNLAFDSNNTERMVITSAGKVQITGTRGGSLQPSDNDTLELFTSATNGSANTGCGLTFYNNDGNGAEIGGTIQVAKENGNVNNTAAYMRFSARANNTDPAEAFRISSGGRVLFGTTSTDMVNNTSGGGCVLDGGGINAAASGENVFNFNRSNGDGTIGSFRSQGSSEGSVSISGSTCSFNGGHLSRWTQLAGGAARTEILRGSVLSNLDEMCVWSHAAIPDVLYTEEDELPDGVEVGDVKTAGRAAYTEDNEQLNRMKVSDVEGDPNVAGVFQCWDDGDDEGFTDDFFCAMTGDFVIRIAQGTTVARGDLLMSAGDGTAKPQDDDIVRSKTVAKVTSTTVSTTYSDGSYCVPCVLMAC